MDKRIWSAHLEKQMSNHLNRNHWEPFWVDEFLWENDITDRFHIEIVEAYNREPDRKGLIIRTKDPIQKKPTKILIDVKYGRPCVDQVFDSIYGVGKDCSKRIIAFEDSLNEKDSKNQGTKGDVVPGLIATMNQYPLGLYLAEVNSDPFKMSLYDLEEFRPEERSKQYKISELPSKLRFREAEFWEVYFRPQRRCSYKPGKAFRSGLIGNSVYGHREESNGIEFSVQWNEKGAVIFMKQIVDNCEDLLDFWRENEGHLKEVCGDNFNLVHIPGKLLTLIYTFWDLPVSWLLSASTDEKWGTAERLEKEYNDWIESYGCWLGEFRAESRARKIPAIPTVLET
jgi:hypothetical protein